jgi:hypothetical protein
MMCEEWANVAGFSVLCATICIIVWIRRQK